MQISFVCFLDFIVVSFIQYTLRKWFHDLLFDQQPMLSG